jgi:hypothetical protein
MPTNEEIVTILDGLRSAREDLELQKSELIRIGTGRGDPALIDAISRFPESLRPLSGAGGPRSRRRPRPGH